MAKLSSDLIMKRKMNIALAVMIIVGFGILISRLYYIQIVEGDFYRAKALSQQLRPTTITAQRGSIYDRNLKTLATSATVFTVTLSPAELRSDEELEIIAEFLSTLLEVDKQKILDQGKLKGSYYEIIKKKVTKEDADKITAFTLENKISCVHLIESTRRYYPYGDLASTVLGFTDGDNKGAYGLESHYNKVLSGTSGMVVSAKNAKGGDMLFSYDKMFEPIDGNSLVLTIDEVIQHSLEKHLETAVIEHNVKNRAVAIAMDVNTGAILGMTSKPDFDPNHSSVLEDLEAPIRIEAYLASDEVQAQLNAISDPAERAEAEAATRQKATQDEWYLSWRNKAISDPYEPGSVFKLLTASMALDLQLVKPTGQTFYCPGYQIVAGRRKGCHKAAGHGTIDFTEAVKFSCNPAFMVVGDMIGPERFNSYFERFGLKEPTGIDLPGEAEGIFYDYETLSKPSGEELASSAFGQTFTVTPIQLITAVSSVVNGGKLMKPYVVNQVLDPMGNVLSTTEPTVVRNVISEETSATMRQIMEKVVGDPDGSGRFAYLPGYHLGGKTGTSEKLDHKDDGTGPKRISSFLGIAPAYDPQIAVLVLLDEPHMENAYGSVIAAPIVGAIMSDVLPYMGVVPQYSEAELYEYEVKVPYVTGQLLHDGISKVNTIGLTYKIVGDGVTILRQLPSAGEVMPKGGTVILYTDEGALPEQITVPNVLEMTGQQANRTILNSRLNIKIVGENPSEPLVVLSQNPPAGTMVNEGTVISISFTEDLLLKPSPKPSETPAPTQEPVATPGPSENLESTENIPPQ